MTPVSPRAAPQFYARMELVSREWRHTKARGCPIGLALGPSDYPLIVCGASAAKVITALSIPDPGELRPALVSRAVVRGGKGGLSAPRRVTDQRVFSQHPIVLAGCGCIRRAASGWA